MPGRRLIYDETHTARSNMPGTNKSRHIIVWYLFYWTHCGFEHMIHKYAYGRDTCFLRAPRTSKRKRVPVIAPDARRDATRGGARREHSSRWCDCAPIIRLWCFLFLRAKRGAAKSCVYASREVCTASDQGVLIGCVNLRGYKYICCFHLYI